MSVDRYVEENRTESRISKYENNVTNNKGQRSKHLLLQQYRHNASRDLSATAELLVKIITALSLNVYISKSAKHQSVRNIIDYKKF